MGKLVHLLPQIVLVCTLSITEKISAFGTYIFLNFTFRIHSKRFNIYIEAMSVTLTWYMGVWHKLRYNISWKVMVNKSIAFSILITLTVSRELLHRLNLPTKTIKCLRAGRCWLSSSAKCQQIQNAHMLAVNCIQSEEVSYISMPHMLFFSRTSVWCFEWCR